MKKMDSTKEKVMNDTVTVPIVGCCARCGEDHAPLSFHKLKNPCGDFTHWTPCPVSGEPIMMQITEDVKLATTAEEQDNNFDSLHQEGLTAHRRKVVDMLMANEVPEMEADTAYAEWSHQQVNAVTDFSPEDVFNELLPGLTADSDAVVGDDNPPSTTEEQDKRIARVYGGDTPFLPMPRGEATDQDLHEWLSGRIAEDPDVALIREAKHGRLVAFASADDADRITALLNAACSEQIVRALPKFEAIRDLAVGSVIEHKDGSRYRVTSFGYCEASKTPMYGYTSETGRTFYRTADEMVDGRFRVLDASGWSYSDQVAAMEIARLALMVDRGGPAWHKIADHLDLEDEEMGDLYARLEKFLSGAEVKS